MDLVVSFFPEKLSKIISSIPPEYFEMGEVELKSKFRYNNKDFLMRSNFRKEYSNAIINGNFKTVNVYRDVCTDNNFYNRIVKNKYRLAYIVSPMMSVADKMVALEDNALAVFEEILLQGEINGEKVTKNEIISVAKAILSMTRGTKQNVEQKQLKLSLTGDDLKNKDEKQIDDEIRELIEGSKNIITQKA